MYLRFVITQVDGDSHQPQGLFIAADVLMKSSVLSNDERKQIQQVLIWFNINLPVPKAAWIQGRAIFWFRVEAKECIQRMWELVRLLQAHDYYVEVHKCEFLGNIVYSDEFQVVAFPHWRDGKRTIK